MLDSATRKLLFRKFWILNPKGEEMIAYSYFDNLITNKSSLQPNGEHMTGEYLIEQYTKYISFMRQFQAKDKQFTKKMYESLMPDEWLEQSGWTKVLIQPYDPLDFYLYGIKEGE